MPSRRDALKAAATVAAGSAAFGQHGHESPAPPLASIQPPQPKVFSEDEWQAISRYADLIIPRTDSPGAADAGVPALMDRAARLDANILPVFRSGVKELDSIASEAYHAPFAKLSEEQQIAMLTKMDADPSAPGAKFFRFMKNMTIDLYYSTQQGLVQELGWHGNTYLSEFKGCTHPEHQEG